MGSAKKGTIQVGLLSIPVRLEVAVDDESSGTRTVCTNDGAHDPTRVKMHVDCPTCGHSETSVWGYGQRGVERDGKLVVLTAEEIKAATGAPIKTMALSFHPREKVYAATVAGDSVQNTSPDKGGEKGYRALVDIMGRHPDLVAVTVWAPATKNALWVLEVVEGRLVASKRAWPEDVRPAPAIAPAEVSTLEVQTFEALIQGTVRDFDVLEYRNAAKVGMEDLVASRYGDAVVLSENSAQPVASGDMLSALQESIAQLAPKPVQKRAAKKVAKKAPARKPAAKKTALPKSA